MSNKPRKLTARTWKSNFRGFDLLKHAHVAQNLNILLFEDPWNLLWGMPYLKNKCYQRSHPFLTHQNLMQVGQKPMLRLQSHARHHFPSPSSHHIDQVSSLLFKKFPMDSMDTASPGLNHRITGSKLPPPQKQKVWQLWSPGGCVVL